MPEFCGTDAASVCGCDEITYANECLAAAAGVTVDYVGECQTGGGACASNDDCGADEFCYADGCLVSEGGAIAEGECQAKPTCCPDEPPILCACSGATYDNVCAAAFYGQRVMELDAICDIFAPSSECETDADCPAGTICEDIIIAQVCQKDMSMSVPSNFSKTGGQFR